MADFDGKNVVVTGAATGLGAAIAIGIARQGARVIINYSSSAAEAEATAEACRSVGAIVRIVRGNVADDADCRRIAEAANDWGSLHVLVNNAGATKHVPKHGDLDALSAKDFHLLYGVNTIGPFQMVRATRALLEAGAHASGHASAVVNVSSSSVFDGSGSSIAYTASKAALNSLTLSLARALAPLIRVNAVCPGYMDTPWWLKGPGREAAETLREAVRSLVPLQVASTAEDVAEVAMFLASSASRNMTGELAVADAGLRLAGR
ncbi:MAG TPA: SDR family oxidoreductase [Stellaceae bacterium]|jgi:NAD(P)-dependent dehydrogenase (short-subunit alcohol dehydrogenase family)